MGWLERWSIIACGWTIVGCTEAFPPASKLESLRVLAVQPSPASGVPGEKLRLSMLLHDGRRGDTAEPQVVWLGGCHNPPSRQFFACYPRIQALTEQLMQAGAPIETPLPLANLVGVGPEFEFDMPEDIIDGAPRVETDPIHFGVSYIFFAVCAGKLRLSERGSGGLPLGCFDPETNERMGSEAYVEGFTTVYSFENEVNSNPVLEGVRFAGGPSSVGACVDDADCEGIGATNGGLGDFGCGSSGTCVPRVERCESSGDGCSEYEVLAEVTLPSAELDPGASLNDAELPREILWTNFYADAGEFSSETRLVHDRESGWVARPSSRFKPSGTTRGSVRLFVTLHDNRGGASWQSVEVLLRDPE